MSDKMPAPSTSIDPDLDWSQIRETVRMLFLAVAQIEIAMQDSDSSVDRLTHAFTTMTEFEMETVSMVEKLPDEDHTQELREKIKNNANQVASEMQEAIVAFQFYDKLSQRLSHVSESIESLSELVGDTARIYSPMEWKALQDAIKSRYSMREEHEMFDSVMNGGNIRDVVKRYFEAHKDNQDDNIEFF
jgi:uncharacterized protein YoxC